MVPLKTHVKCLTNEQNVDFSKNTLNEVGKLVPKDFEYRSDNNVHFLTVQEIIKLNNNFFLVGFHIF